jgi:hypothetical protein
VALGSTGAGEAVAREVKLLGPPTTQWLAGRVNLPVVDPLLFDREHDVLHGPDPYFRVGDLGDGGWQVRGLAPDAVRIELTGLRTHDAEHVITSMAQAVLDVHGVDRTRLEAARADAAALDAHWLRRAVEVMATNVRTDYQHWRSAAG